MQDPTAAAIEHSRHSNQKIARMASIAVQRIALPEGRPKAVSEAVAAVQWKFTVASIHLEELWHISEGARLSLVDLIDNATAVHRWDDRETTDGTKCLEAFLFQARAFIDVYMRLACEMTVVRPPVIMSTEAFLAALRDPLPGADQKAGELRRYFEERVFSPTAWGSLIRGLRDKVAHRDVLRPRQDGSEHVSGIRLDWPTVRRLTYDRLAQEFQNGAFELIHDTTTIIFELPWQSGPYRPDAWEAG